MYSAKNISKHIVNKCIDDKCPISNLQLQKILYYIQKEYLKSKNAPIFPDEIEAWQFGPVVPEVYYFFCGFGAMRISLKFDYDKTEKEISSDDTKIIDRIVEVKRRLEPWDMVNETHKKGGAWDKTYRDGLGNHQIISKELIKTIG